MPESAFSKIVCTKCGAQLPAPGYACPKCQGPLAKICGNCSFQNAVAKNYCDRCGTPMTLAPGAESAPPFGEAGAEEKFSVSHRGQALRAMLAALDQEPLPQEP